jgi:hypothetical protein
MKFSYFLGVALVASLFLAAPAPSSAQITVGVGVSIAPPAIPIYAQPACPSPNFLWQPGYWAWGPGGYFWVPGTWVAPPSIGLLWTPGYWGWNNNAFFWHRGYWGRTVGFYGGINYGFGFFGSGFVGGRWIGNSFHYNTAITNVNRTVIHNTYNDRTVIRLNNNNRTSFNGGRGGIDARPTQEETTARSRGQTMTSEQRYHEQTAAQDRNHLSTVNRGHPNTAAISHPYSATNRPPHFTPVTSADRQAAQQHVTGQQPQHANQQHGNRPPS